MNYWGLKLAAALGAVLAYGTWRQQTGTRRPESRRARVERCIDETEALGSGLFVGAAESVPPRKVGGL